MLIIITEVKNGDSLFERATRDSQMIMSPPYHCRLTYSCAFQRVNFIVTIIVIARNGLQESLRSRSFVKVVVRESEEDDFVSK